MKLRFSKQMFAEKINQREAGCRMPEFHIRNLLFKPYIERVED
jgi:hypothetical protein